MQRSTPASGQNLQLLIDNIHIISHANNTLNATKLYYCVCKQIREGAGEELTVPSIDLPIEPIDIIIIMLPILPVLEYSQHFGSHHSHAYALSGELRRRVSGIKRHRVNSKVVDRCQLVMIRHMEWKEQLSESEDLRDRM